jgi:hypothetical protein
MEALRRRIDPPLEQSVTAYANLVRHCVAIHARMRGDGG